MSKREWIKTTPGTIVLTGTDMSIVYLAGGMTFQIFQGERTRSRHQALVDAKIVAEQIWNELVEIGAVDEAGE